MLFKRVVGGNIMSVSKPLNHNFHVPVKRIHDGPALHAFQQSIALKDLTISLTTIAKLVENKDVPAGVLHKEDLYDVTEREKYDHEPNVQKLGTPDVFHGEKVIEQTQLEKIYASKPLVKAIVELLHNITQLVDDIPPIEGPRRYGNFACRTWHDQLVQKMDSWIDVLIVKNYYKGINSQGFLDEIKWYLLNAFGSRERLDYGTGHELNFLAFLTGLVKVNVFKFDETDNSNINQSNKESEDIVLDGYDFLVIFGSYYDVVRKLITTYTLEPAGSHGVWGLDDHFHIIYILGSSQILNPSGNTHHVQEFPPKYTQNRSIVYQYSTKNLYFNAIAFIFKVKKGPFFEHSPILYDVSKVKNWEKIVKGMFKMFQVEVVGKFPVVQHFYFGGVLFPWLNANTLQPLPISTTDDQLQNEEVVETEDNDKTPTPSIISENESNNKESFITAVPWKSNRPKESLQDRILNNNSTITRAPFADNTNNNGKPIPNTSSTRPTRPTQININRTP